MRKIVALMSLLIIALFGYAGRGIGELVATEHIDSASVAVMIVDLHNDSVLESFNATKSMIPASVMKAVTIGSLIGSTGIDYRYSTRVYMCGDVVNGVLNGNLLIVGGGDPSLNAQSGPQSGDIVEECVNALKKEGVNQIKGDIKVNQSIFPAPSVHPTWAKEDLKYGYGAGCFGINFENNSYIKGSQSYSMANPAATMIRRIKEACGIAGIAIDGMTLNDSNSRKLIVDHRSATIDEIMRHCMRVSDNLYAESMLRTLAMVEGQSATTANGVELENKMWRGKNLSFNGVNIVDGSGLSRTNRMTATFLTDVLKEMSGNVDYVSFFPLAGQEGTLKSFLKDTELDSYIALKTGSMRGIQCYAGYKLDDDYAPTHVVVIMINNFKCSRSIVRELCEKMLLKTFIQ